MWIQCSSADNAAACNTYASFVLHTQCLKQSDNDVHIQENKPEARSSRQAVETATARARSAFEKAGVLLHEAEPVATSMEYLGVQLDGVKGEVCV